MADSTKLPVAARSPGSSFRWKPDSLVRRLGVSEFWRLDDSAGLQLWRTKILVSALWTVAVLGIFAYIPSVAMAFTHGDLQIIVVDTLALGALIFLLSARRTSYRIRAVGLLLVCYLIGLYFTWFFGPFAAGPLWLFATPVLAALLFGLPGAAWTLAATAVTLAALGVSLQLSVVSWHEAVSAAMWIVISSSFLVLAGLLAVSIAVLLHGLVQIHAQFEREVEAGKEAKQQLEQAARLDALGRLTGGIAHDFNNILTAILGYVDIVRSGLGEGSELIADVDGIGESARRAAALTRQLLAFSRQQDLRVAAIDVNALVGSIEGMLRRLIREDIDLRLDLEAELWPALGDRAQLEQVIVNLVVNAADAISGHGAITVGTRNQTIDADHAAALAIGSGDYVEMIVEDTGAGMTEDVRLHVFDPFFTTKETGKGTGLGLATVHGIVVKTGGCVVVESELGCGSRFTVHLPRAGVPVAQSTVDEAPAGTGCEGVLIVEDDGPIRDLTARALRSSGYTVFAAATPAEAVAIARAHGDTIRLLLSDVVMPEMNGPELARLLEQHLPRASVLFMSGYAGDILERNGVKPTEWTLIEKPFSKRELLNRIRKILDRRSDGGL